MINCTYEGLKKYIRVTEQQAIELSVKKEFKCFEWESIKGRDIGLATKIRMMKVENKKLVPTTKWNKG